MTHRDIRFEFGEDAFLPAASFMVASDAFGRLILVRDDHFVLLAPLTRCEQVQLQLSFALLGDFFV